MTQDDHGCQDGPVTAPDLVAAVAMLERRPHVTTAADAFREIEGLAVEARRLLRLGRDDFVRRSACGHIEGVQLLAQNGLREALENEPKLAACPVLFCACTKLLAEYDGCSGPSEFGDRAVAEKLIEGIRDATAKALESNTGEPT